MTSWYWDVRGFRAGNSVGELLASIPDGSGAQSLAYHIAAYEEDHGYERIEVKRVNHNQGESRMPQLMTSSMLAGMGCPSEHCAEMQGFDLPQGVLQDMRAKGIKWLALLQFVRKWGPLGVQFLTALSGGIGGIVAFAVAHAAELPELIADLVAIFGGGADAAPPNSPIIT